MKWRNLIINDWFNFGGYLHILIYGGGLTMQKVDNELQREYEIEKERERARADFKTELGKRKSRRRVGVEVFKTVAVSGVMLYILYFFYRCFQGFI